MGDVVVSEFVTLDGVFEDPGGSESSQWGGWAFRFDRGPEGDKFKVEETPNAAAMVLGGGRRLFSDGNATAAFELVDCRPAAQCAILVYRRPRA